jgi:hypothetical protein
MAEPRSDEIAGRVELPDSLETVAAFRAENGLAEDPILLPLFEARWTEQLRSIMHDCDKPSRTFGIQAEVQGSTEWEAP